MQHIVLHVTHSVSSPLIAVPFSERTRSFPKPFTPARQTLSHPTPPAVLLAHAARDRGECVGQAGQPQSVIAPVASASKSIRIDRCRFERAGGPAVGSASASFQFMRGTAKNESSRGGTPKAPRASSGATTTNITVDTNSPRCPISLRRACKCMLLKRAHTVRG
jgi:hypothetical protein